MSPANQSSSGNRVQSESTQGDILYGFLYALFKRKYFAVLVCGVTFLGILFGTYLVTTSWKATAKIRVQYSSKQQLSMFEGITTPAGQVSGVNPANDIIQMLTSRELAEKLVKSFKRDKLWEQRTNDPQSVKEIIRGYIYDFLIGKPLAFLQYIGVLKDKPDNYLASAVDEMLDDLEDIELEEDTTVIDVGVWGESPEIATALSNKLVELAMEKNKELSKLPLRSMLEATKVQLAVADKNLKDSQERFRKYKIKSGILSYDQEATILLNRLDKYGNELKDMEGQLASLRIEKSVNHPEVRALGAKIEEYKNTIIPKIKERLKALPLEEVEYDRLSQDMKVHQDLYTTLKGKILEIEALMNSDVGDVEIKVLDSAKVYSYVKPDWPKMAITIPLALMASLFSAIAFVLLIEYWSTSFTSLKDIESEVPIPALGAIPMIPFYNRKKVFASMIGSGSHAGGNKLLGMLTEKVLARSLSAYERLADSIRLKNMERPSSIYLISSPGRGEGKSTTAVFLARALAKRGKKVLVVEADMRAPSLEGILDVKPSRGLMDYYSSDLGADGLVVSACSLAVIFAGDPLRNKKDPFEVLASDKMTELLKYARENYEYVLIDTPCTTGFRDALLLARAADGVILTVEADQTSRRSLLGAVEKVREAGGTVSGIVLTKRAEYVPEILQSFLD